MFGFKCFLLPSGVDEFPHLDDAGLREALAELARLDALLVVHAEDEGDDRRRAARRTAARVRRLRRAPARRGRGLVAIERLVGRPRRTGGRVHVVHLSARRRAADDPRAPAPRACGSPSRPARTT